MNISKNKTLIQIKRATKEVPLSIFYASIGYMLSTIGFLISGDGLAILTFLSLLLPMVFSVGFLTKNCSDSKLPIIAIGAYVAQVGIFFLVFSLFFHEVENLIMSALLLVTYSMCIFTVVVEWFACLHLMSREAYRNKVEYILNTVWIICLVISYMLLAMKGTSSNQLLTFLILSVFGRVCFELCDYLKTKPNKPIN